MFATIIPLLALAVIATVLGSIFWSMRRKGKVWQPPYPLVDLSPAEMEEREIDLRDKLSHEEFGEARAAALWRRLAAVKDGDGLILEFHRDFCGHGLIRRGDGIVLCDVFDGGYNTGDAIADWERQDEFVAFFARQSDFSCSGWDEDEPVFHSGDSWYRNNQRLTRATIDSFLAGRVKG